MALIVALADTAWSQSVPATKKDDGYPQTRRNQTDGFIEPIKRVIDRKEDVMKEILQHVRVGMLVLMVITFISLFLSLGPRFHTPCYVLGVEGLILVVLTLLLRERLVQKMFFLITGAAGSGFLFTLGAFQVLSWLGHKPAGDGGGPTVALLIIVFPALFLIGAIGSIVCLIRAPGAATKAEP